MNLFKIYFFIKKTLLSVATRYAFSPRHHTYFHVLFLYLVSCWQFMLLLKINNHIKFFISGKMPSYIERNGTLRSTRDCVRNVNEFQN